MTDRSFGLGMLAICSAAVGDFETARAYSRESQSLNEEIGMWYALTGSYEASGAVEWLAGNATTGAQLYRRSLDAQLATGDRGHASTTGLRLAAILIAMGRLDEADELIRECEELSTMGDVVDVGLAATGRAQLLSARGDGAAALAEAQRAVAAFEPTQLPIDHGDALVALANARLQTGDRVGARAAATRALAFFEKKGAPVFAERARDVLARLDAGA